MGKVMVLGAGGWLGRRLVEHLTRAGREVICVDVSFGDEMRGFPGIEVVEADIRDAARLAPLLEECVTVFNCAGLLHPAATREMYAVNRDAPAALYQACIDNGVGSFVHVSSINAQGGHESPGELFDETIPPKPTTHYGLSKAQGDAMLTAMAGQAKTRLIILRPGVFYGEFPSRNLRHLIDRIQRYPVLLFGRRGFLRTYVDVNKVVAAMLLSEHGGRSGETYILGDREPLSTLHFYRIVCEELGAKPTIVRAPVMAARLCERIAFLAGKVNAHLRLLTIVGEFGRDILGSVGKAERELGFVPHRSSEEGLRRMVRSVHAKRGATSR